ncbi:MAG TPA: RNA polymerase sigma factor [Thermoleophilaceae bacterium]|jgi:RNA polymerase sigma factor (sigma-70 family)
MEAGALNHGTAVLPGLSGRSPLLRLKGDEQLIELTRKGQHGAFEALVQRYQSRLLAFCRHMLNSTEDAEDVLQEVFAAAFNAMIADARPINARPWLYRIARNRCLNHLRRPTSAGQDSMDVFERDGGATTADTVHKREEFRQIVADVQDLPETQRTALLLREIDALSYDDISVAMDTTVPSVKSLLVRARVSLAEAAEARLLTCGEVRLELGHVAEGIAKSSAPVRRHLKGCERCRVFKGELRRANKALAAVYPLGPLVLVKKFLAAKLSIGAGATGASTAGGGSGGAGFAGSAAAAASGAASSAGASAGGLLSAGLGTVASKAVAGFAAAAIVTAGAVEAKHVVDPQPAKRPALAAVSTPSVPVAPAPLVIHATEHPHAVTAVPEPKTKPAAAKATATSTTQPAVATTPAPAATPAAAPASQPAAQQQQPTATSNSTQHPSQPATQEESSTVVLDGSGDGGGSQGSGSTDGSTQGSGPGQSSPPGESPSAPPQPQPAPIAGESDPGPHLSNAP